MLFALLLVVLLQNPQARTADERTPSVSAYKQHLPETHGKLPLSFEGNQGQTGALTKFFAHGPGYTLFLTRRRDRFVAQVTYLMICSTLRINSCVEKTFTKTAVDALRRSGAIRDLAP